jgi:hypothetical protein
MKIKVHLLILLFVLVSTCIFSQTIVSTNGRDILVNSVKYQIRGVCYYPIAKGNNRNNALDFSHIDKDIQLMQEAKINTIRTYIPIMNETVLDKFAAGGIKIIIGIPNYDDTNQYPDINHGTYITYINTHKNHPAILMWELGNEYNYHPEWFSNKINNWYSILNNAADSIHKIDPNHPVSTAHGEAPTSTVLSLCPSIDVWGMNVYRWDNPSGAITDFAGRSNKPCYISESGGDRYNTTKNQEDQQGQSDANLTIWSHIVPLLNTCSGITFFSWVDEWWKYRKGKDDTHDTGGFSMSIPYDRYANEEWWGLVDIDRNTTISYSTLKSAFTVISGIQGEMSSNDFEICLNPTSKKITLNFRNQVPEKFTLNFTSLTGQLIFRSKISKKKSTLELSLEKYKLNKDLYKISLSNKGYKACNIVFIQ